MDYNFPSPIPIAYANRDSSPLKNYLEAGRSHSRRCRTITKKKACLKWVCSFITWLRYVHKRLLNKHITIFLPTQICPLLVPSYRMVCLNVLFDTRDFHLQNLRVWKLCIWSGYRYSYTMRHIRRYIRLRRHQFGLEDLQNCGKE